MMQDIGIMKRSNTVPGEQMKLIEIIDHREAFIKSFLLEFPQQHQFETWPGIDIVISEWKHYYPEKIVDLTNNFYKLTTDSGICYWFEQDSKIILGCELEKQQYSWVVTMIGKDPKFRGTSPFASDLYLKILQDSKDNICIMSDKLLSDEGYAIWQKLFSAGCKVSVYDKNSPGQTYTRLQSMEDMNKYFGLERNYRNFQYVLSESNLGLLNTFTKFHLRKMHEDNDIL